MDACSRGDCRSRIIKSIAAERLGLTRYFDAMCNEGMITTDDACLKSRLPQLLPDPA